MSKEEKRISDMYLAAALLSYGAELCRIDRENKKRQKFCFEDCIEYVWRIEDGGIERLETPSIDEIETLFISKRLIFPPHYHDCIKSIKSAIYSTEDD